MKSLKEIISQDPVYLYGFTDRDSVISEFEEAYTKEELEECRKKYEGVNILFASYEVDLYGDNFVLGGDAFVLFEKDGKLYEVNGGHCSCYGLGGQWEPEETSLEALEYRLRRGTFGEGFREELCKFLGIS